MATDRMKTGNARRRWMNGLFLAPFLLLFLMWGIAPIITGFAISFTKWDVFSGEVHFVGISNYLRILDDDILPIALWNTIKYTFLTVLFGNALSFVLAYGLARDIKGKTIFQTICFAPVVLSIGVTGVVWAWMYNTDFGILNYWLGQIGIPPIHWLTNPSTAMYAIVAMVVWASAGFNMMIYLAGLLNVPPSLYEAAEIDGANAWKQLLNITLPLMKYTFAFTLTISTIGSLQVFDQPYILTGGGPDYATHTLVYHIYSHGFRYFRIGYASALSFFLAVIICGFSFFQYWVFTRRRTEL